MTDQVNAADQIESRALAAAKEPSDNTKQAVRDGLEVGSSKAKDYYQKRRDGMSDFDTGQMVKVGALPPKPEFFDSSVQKTELRPSGVDAVVRGLGASISDLVMSDLVNTGAAGDTVLHKNKPGESSVPAEVPGEGFLDVLPIKFLGTGPIFGVEDVPRVTRGPNIKEAPAEEPSSFVRIKDAPPVVGPGKDAPHGKELPHGKALPHNHEKGKGPNIHIEPVEPLDPGHDSPNIKIAGASDTGHGSTGSSHKELDLKAAYKRNETRIDKDGDGFFSQEEIDAAMHDKSFKGDDARFVAMLKENGKEIQKLNDDEIGPESRGVSFGDIEKLDLLKAEHSKEKIVSAVDYSLNSSEETLSRTNHELFTNGDAKVSIKPDAVRQGAIGDCYFLAAVASLASTNPEAVQKMIKDNKDGTYTVTFPGDPEHPLTVEAPTDAELAHYTHGNEYGTWPAVLEKAYGKYRGGTQDEADGGAIMAKGVDLLSPGGVDTDLMGTTTEAELDEKLQETLKNGRPITASINNYGPLAKYIVDDGLVDGHVYSVVGYDPNTKMVMVRNPWGEGEPLNADGTAKDGNNDGQFQMSLADFQRNFNRVSYGQDNNAHRNTRPRSSDKLIA